MPQPTAANRVAYWTAVGLIWSLAAWHAWEARALFGDGANFFIHAVQLDRFVHFYPARDYAMLASQVPLLAALKLGVDDLAWLARIFGIGVFGLPTAFYHLALARARRDTVLLAIVIAAIALVFMSTSFCAERGAPGVMRPCASYPQLHPAARASLSTRHARRPDSDG